MKLLSVIKNKVKKYLLYTNVIKPRLNYASNDLKEKFKTAHKTLSNSEKQEIINFWNNYHSIKEDLKWFEFYKAIVKGEDNLKYFVPDSIYYAYIDTFFTSPTKAGLVDDKNMYDCYFSGVDMPKTLFRKMNGILLDESYTPITIYEALERIGGGKSVICKKSVESEGGKGIRFFNSDTDSKENFVRWLDNQDNLIVQDLIKQHKALSFIHDKSVNTIRIITLLIDGRVHILSAVLRMGINGALVDNASSGGIVCGIDENGKLREYAFDTKGNSFSSHPQGIVFNGYQIYGFDKCCKIVENLSYRMSSFSSLISWDMSVSEKEEPILIECNLTYGEIDFHQMCNGPIFKSLTPYVLEKVFFDS